MENGFYAARVADESVRSVYVDEDTVYYMQTARLFRRRDDAQADELKRVQERQRKADCAAAREQRKLRKAVKECAGWLGIGMMVCTVHYLGPMAVIFSAIACFGAACYKLGGYFRRGRSG